MPSNADRRQFGRRTARQLAWILVPGRPKLPCVATSLTPKRAILELQSPKWLPFQFEVLLDGCRTRRLCEVRHATTTAIGVEFAVVHAEAAREARPSAPPTHSDFDEWAGGARPLLNLSGRS